MKYWGFPLGFGLSRFRFNSPLAIHGVLATMVVKARGAEFVALRQLKARFTNEISP